jgi:predicted MFS family arabinose efflux permease
MSFEQWIRKKWYIPFLIIFLVGATLQFVGDTYGLGVLGRFGTIVGVFVAWGISYILYKA